MSTASKERQARLYNIVKKLFPKVIQQILKECVSPRGLQGKHKQKFIAIDFTENELSLMEKLPNIDDFTIELCYKILRYENVFCEPSCKWGNIPHDADIAIGDDVQRILNATNDVISTTSDEISQLYYEEFQKRTQEVLKRVDKYLCQDTSIQLYQTIQSSDINITDMLQELTMMKKVNDATIYISSLDKNRCAKCSMVVMEVFPKIMQELMAKTGIPAKTLYDTIMRKDPFRLKLNQMELDMVDTLQTDEYTKIDVSLAYKIIVNFVKLLSIPPPSRQWGAKPNDTEIGIGDDIERIRGTRNSFVHRVDTNISEALFGNFFVTFIEVGKRIDAYLNKPPNNGYAHDVEQCKTCVLDPEVEKKLLDARADIEQLKEKYRFYIENSRIEIHILCGKSTDAAIEKNRIEKSEEESFTKLKIYIHEVDDSEGVVHLINLRTEDLNSENIIFKGAEKGSVMLFIDVKNRVVQDDGLFLNEISTFFRNLIKCCNLTCYFHTQTYAVIASPTEEFEEPIIYMPENATGTCLMGNKGLVVVNFEVKNKIFHSPDSLNRTLIRVFKTLVIKGNGHYLLGKTDVYAELVISETTGASQPQLSEEKSDVAKMQDIAKSEDHSWVVAYIKDNMDNWKKEPVKFGIIGRTATGKSSFVNLVRDVKEGEKGFAEVGRGVTTQSPTPYFHPDNNQIVFWDLPGVGTLEFPKETYIDQMELHEYDYFFVFFDTVLQEGDLWLAKQLIKMKKPFCLVRSKVDKDVKKGLKKGIDEKTVYVNLRTKTFKSLNKHIHLKAHCKIFFISGKKKGVGEIDKLFRHIKENLSSIKSEAVVYTLNTLSQEVIEEKFKSLKSRVKKASLGTALIAAAPIPGMDIYANIEILVKEIKHYIEVFGLTSKQIRKVSYREQKQLKCRELFGLSNEKKTHKIVTAMFIEKYEVLFAALSISNIFLPIVGSIVSAASTATIVYKFLNEILENLHQDAIFVYDLILPLPVRIIRTLRVRFENEGQEGLNKYIFDMLDRWKKETVMIGVIGEPNSGKNEFINQIRRLKMNNSGFSKENKTTVPYFHPDNERIVFIGTDISGLKEIKIGPYDDFYIFLNGDIHTDDICILRDLTKIEKSFSVIRTKYVPPQHDPETILGTGLAWLRLDTDLELAELFVERDEEIDSVRLRKIICSEIFKDNECENDSYPNVCVLSCLHISIGEINELINHMIKNLPLPKSEAVVNTLYPLSKLVIEEKFQYLKKRIVYLATAATSTTALQIPSICFPLNTHILADELKHYIKVFRFSDKGDGSHKISDVDINTLLCKELLEPGVVLSDIIHTQIKVLSSDDNIAANENIADLFYPVAGSLVSSANNAAIVYKCLTAFLEDFRHDAFVVYDHV